MVNLNNNPRNTEKTVKRRWASVMRSKMTKKQLRTQIL